MKGKLLIEIDFKQKLAIGLSPRQVSSESLITTSYRVRVWDLVFIMLMKGKIKSNSLISTLFHLIYHPTESRGFWILRQQQFFKDELEN